MNIWKMEVSFKDFKEFSDMQQLLSESMAAYALCY